MATGKGPKDRPGLAGSVGGPVGDTVGGGVLGQLGHHADVAPAWTKFPPVSSCRRGMLIVPRRSFQVFGVVPDAAVGAELPDKCGRRSACLQTGQRLFSKHKLPGGRCQPRSGHGDILACSNVVGASSGEGNRLMMGSAGGQCQFPGWRWWQYGIYVQRANFAQAIRVSSGDRSPASNISPSGHLRLQRRLQPGQCGPFRRRPGSRPEYPGPFCRRL